ncbi:MAG: haloacid dehalogenase-like hydrolase [Myxococcota bacterium]
MKDLLDELFSLPPGDAVFDLDGTLIHRDVGEAALKRRIAKGPLPGAARVALGDDDPWGVYERMDPVTQAVAAAQALAGMTLGECEQIVDDIFAAGEIEPNAAVCELAAAVARHHRVWIVSGSAEALVRAVAPRVGVRNVVGVRLAVEGGRLTDRVIGPVSCAAGKVDAAWVALGRRPVFSIGDSPWDSHLHAMARVARTVGRTAGVGWPAFP